MTESEFNLGQLSFGHKRASISLTANASLRLLCNSSPSSICTDIHRWLLSVGGSLPRARSFLLVFSLTFPIVSESVCALSPKDVEVIATYIEQAELWSQLGYQAMQFSFQDNVYIEASKSLLLTFHIWTLSNEYTSSLSWPEGVFGASLASIQLNLSFSPASYVSATTIQKVVEHCKIIGTSMAEQATHASSKSCNDPPRLLDSQKFCHSHQSTMIHAERVNDDKTKVTTTAIQPTLTDWRVVMGFIDAALRNFISERPIQLATYIKYQDEAVIARLCDISPATFVPNYAKQLAERVKYVPGIGKFLRRFSKDCLTSWVSPECCPPSIEEPDLDREMDRICGRLWITATWGLSLGQQARRLQPLWRELPIGDELPDVHKAEMKGGACTTELAFEALDEAYSSQECAAISNPPIEKTCLNTSFHVRASDKHRNLSTDFSSLSQCFEGERSKNPTLARMSVQGRIRKELQFSGGFPSQRSSSMNSSSSESDVSMLMDFRPSLNQPTKKADILWGANIIGGEKMSQDRIRPHPLIHLVPGNQLGGDTSWVDDVYCLYQRTSTRSLGLSEVDDQSRASHQQAYFNVEPADSTWPGEDEDLDILSLILDREHLKDPSEAESVDETLLSMSCSGRSTANPSSPNDIGDDPLLWEMWKRRVSIGPRREQDILEMKAMFESDPDMKLFGYDWNLNDDDFGPGKQDTPMARGPPSPEYVGRRMFEVQHASAPGSPTSRSIPHVFPTRTSSSSSECSSSDPKNQRRTSLIKRFTWGGKGTANSMAQLDGSYLDGREVEVKRRKTLDDYETKPREDDDDSNEMLF